MKHVLAIAAAFALAACDEPQSGYSTGPDYNSALMWQMMQQRPIFQQPTPAFGGMTTYSFPNGRSMLCVQNGMMVNCS